MATTWGDKFVAEYFRRFKRLISRKLISNFNLNFCFKIVPLSESVIFKSGCKNAVFAAYHLRGKNFLEEIFKKEQKHPDKYG